MHECQLQRMCRTVLPWRLVELGNLSENPPGWDVGPAAPSRTSSLTESAICWGSYSPRPQTDSHQLDEHSLFETSLG